MQFEEYWNWKRSVNIKDMHRSATMVRQMYMNDKQLLLEMLKGNPIVITHTTVQNIPVVKKFYQKNVKVNKIKHSKYKFENASITSTKKFRSKYGQI